MHVADISFSPTQHNHSRTLESEAGTTGRDPCIQYICIYAALVSRDHLNKLKVLLPHICLPHKPTMQENKEPRNSVKYKQHRQRIYYLDITHTSSHFQNYIGLSFEYACRMVRHFVKKRTYNYVIFFQSQQFYVSVCPLSKPHSILSLERPFKTGWWFQAFYIFHNIWDNHSH